MVRERERNRLLFLELFSLLFVLFFSADIALTTMARIGCLATLFVLLYCSVLLVSAQDCPLPNNTQIETAMRDLPTGGDGSQALNPNITEPVHYVCLAQGNMINTYKFLSVIATYTPSPGQSAVTNIFQLRCSNGVWTADTNGQPMNPDPSVRNVTRYDCVQCNHNYGVTRCRGKPTYS